MHLSPPTRRNAIQDATTDSESPLPPHPQTLYKPVSAVNNILPPKKKAGAANESGNYNNVQ